MPQLNEMIPKNNKEIQDLLEKIAYAESLAAIIIIGLAIAKVLAVNIIEKILQQRAQEKCKWERCPKCKAQIEKKE